MWNSAVVEELHANTKVKQLSLQVSAYSFVYLKFNVSCSLRGNSIVSPSLWKFSLPEMDLLSSAMLCSMLADAVLRICSSDYDFEVGREF